jgi:HlyD family secretion protein
LNRSRWIIVAVMLVAAVSGVWWWKSRAAGAAPKYRTAEVDRGSIESVVSATGTIRPVVQVEVGSQVSGTVDKLYADYNSRVRAGQVICQLEPSSFRAREMQAEAAVARAEASVKDGERGLARAQELFNQKYVSQAELDAAVVALELRKADLKQARAQLEAAQVDLRHTTIRAPIDGVVISRSIDLGQTVAASLQAPKLFVIANNLSQMQVETRIDEADIGQMRPGLPVSFTVDAFPDREFDGQVAQVRLEPIVEQGVVTYTTVIHTVNPEMRLRPGMTANVTVKIERREDVLRVPNAALRFRPAEAGGGAGGSRANGAVSSPRGAAGIAAGTGTGAGAAAGPSRGAPGRASVASREGDAQAAPRGGNGRAGGTGVGGGERGAMPDSARVRSGQRMGAEGMPEPSDEQRAAWRERMRGLSPEDRQRMRDSMMSAGRARAGGDSPAELVRLGVAGGATRGLRHATEPGSVASDLIPPPSAPVYRPGMIYLLKDGKPARTFVLSGLTDGAFTEVRGEAFKPGDKVIVGMELSARGPSLQPPPGMGGLQFRGPGGRR